MNRLLGYVTKNLVTALGLALVMVTILLWGADRWARLAAAAPSPPVPQALRSTDPILPAWNATQVFTIYYQSTQAVIWTIAPCNVVITLPQGLIGSDHNPASTVFTFTTEPAQDFPSPLTSIDAFFRLTGSTPKLLSENLDPAAIEPQDLSFARGKSPTLEWRYQNSEITSLSESTLRLYREWGLFGDQPWKPQNGFVDAGNNRAVFSLEQPDLYGFGGYRSRYHLPIVLQSFPSNANP